MNPLIYFNTCCITNCFLEVSLFILSFSFQVLSLLPPIIIKLLEWVGFSGDRVHFLNFVMLYVLLCSLSMSSLTTPKDICNSNFAWLVQFCLMVLLIFSFRNNLFKTVLKEFCFVFMLPVSRVKAFTQGQQRSKFKITIVFFV